MIDEKFLLQALFKTLFLDKKFAVSIISVFKKSYFDNATVASIFYNFKLYLREFKNLPTREIILNSIPEDQRTNAKVFFGEIDSIEFDPITHYDWILENTNHYLKDRAIKQAILSSVDLIEKGGETLKIKKMVEEALCKDLKINIGLDYFGTLGERLHKVFTNSEHRLPSYFPSLDEYISGGFPPYTLNLFVARVHGFKSGFMANVISRQVQHGHKIAIASLEMSELMFAARFDAIYSKLDINRIYTNKEYQKKLVNSLKEIKDGIEGGFLGIKQYPTGKASANDFRMWLRELDMRGNRPEAFYCDYINLMKPAYKSKDSLYSDVKGISEDLRAMGEEFDIPIISVSQLNRSGMFSSFEDVDMHYIAESIGAAATADSVFIFGKDSEKMVYECELSYKIVKNRLGGRIGVIDKFYYDAKSLKMYDVHELEEWFSDARISGDERNIFENDGEEEGCKNKKPQRADEDDSSGGGFSWKK